MDQNVMKMVHSLFTTVCGLSDYLLAQRGRNRSPRRETERSRTLENRTPLQNILYEERNILNQHKNQSNMRQILCTLFTTVCGLSDAFIVQRGGNRRPKWRKWYEDGATLKRHT